MPNDIKCTPSKCYDHKSNISVQMASQSIVFDQKEGGKKMIKLEDEIFMIKDNKISELVVY